MDISFHRHTDILYVKKKKSHCKSTKKGKLYLVETCDRGDKNGNFLGNQGHFSNEQAVHQLAFYLRISKFLTPA